MPHLLVRTGVSTLLLMSAAFAPINAKESSPVSEPIPVASDGPLPSANARRSVQLPSGRVTYRATWWEAVLKDVAGAPQATISATAYVREGVREAANRPVIFLFNGGPGASSSPLHFRAFGPRMLTERDSAGNQQVQDNPDSLIDVADLVFIDPVGTGFSRPLRANGGNAYWSIDGDAGAALALAREWLAANGRTLSPVYFAGESYGGYRIGAMACQMGNLNLAGLILISPALNFGTSADQQAINALPTMALAAWYQRGRADGRQAAQVWEDARRFAQGEYASALQLGSSLQAQEAQAVADRIAALTGMDPTTITKAELRPSSQTFLETLVPGSTVGRLDVRVVAPNRALPARGDRPAAANDPSLGLGKRNVIVSRPIAAYLRDELGVRTDRDYYSLTLDVNFAWNWSQPDPRPGQGWGVAGNIAALMRDKPQLRLLVLSGYYDLATPALGTRHAIDHSGIPRERTTMLEFPVGHSVAEGDEGRALSGAALRKFLTAPRQRLLP